MLKILFLLVVLCPALAAAADYPVDAKLEEMLSYSVEVKEWKKCESLPADNPGITAASPLDKTWGILSKRDIANATIGARCNGGDEVCTTDPATDTRACHTNERVCTLQLSKEVPSREALPTIFPLAYYVGENGTCIKRTVDPAQGKLEVEYRAQIAVPISYIPNVNGTSFAFPRETVAGGSVGGMVTSPADGSPATTATLWVTYRNMAAPRTDTIKINEHTIAMRFQ